MEKKPTLNNQIPFYRFVIYSFIFCHSYVLSSSMNLHERSKNKTSINQMSLSLSRFCFFLRPIYNHHHMSWLLDHHHHHHQKKKNFFWLSINKNIGFPKDRKKNDKTQTHPVGHCHSLFLLASVNRDLKPNIFNHFGFETKLIKKISYLQYVERLLHMCDGNHVLHLEISIIIVIIIIFFDKKEIKTSSLSTTTTTNV